MTEYVVKESARHAKYRMESDGQEQEENTGEITLKGWEMKD
jgi:hypothetical protein